MAAIKQYIAADNPIAAEQVVTYIIATADSLSAFPLLGRMGRKAGTRELVVPQYPYLLVYRLTASKVTILTVAHQSRKHR